MLELTETIENTTIIITFGSYFRQTPRDFRQLYKTQSFYEVIILLHNAIITVTLYIT